MPTGLMSEERILILGNSPLPPEEGILCQTAFGLRTYQFMSALQDADADVLVILLSNAKHYENAPQLNSPRPVQAFGKTFQIIDLDEKDRHFASLFSAAVQKFDPTACIGVNIHASYILAQHKLKVPFWADLNGWSMAEAQSQSAVEGSDAYLPTIWKYEQAVLKAADHFSTVSHPQQYATFGELATLGRMNQHTDEYPFLSHIPNANECHRIKKPVADYQLRKELNIDQDSFIVFFSGAYNTWLDSDMMFEGVEQAMNQHRSMHFVSTGGAAAVSNKTLNRFKQRIAASEHKDRFHFLGWITSEELLACYQQVNVAINIDRPNHETTFGARNRINEWLSYKVPVLSTVGSEISQDLANAEVMIPVKISNSKDLAKKLSKATTSDLKEMAEKAFSFAEKYYSYEKTMEPLKAWLKHPETAPDKGKIPNIQQDNIFKKAFFKIKNEGVTEVFKKLWKRIC